MLDDVKLMPSIPTLNTGNRSRNLAIDDDTTSLGKATTPASSPSLSVLSCWMEGASVPKINKKKARRFLVK